MKPLASFLTLLLLLFGASCGKEESIETPRVIESISSLKSTGGACLPSNLGGVFMAGKSVTTDEYLDVQLDVLKPGNYSIVSDTINGLSFKGEGEFINTGLNTIRLQAAGTPVDDGLYAFIVSNGSTFCTIEVPVAADNTGPAVFTLGADPSDPCTGTVLNGSYTVDAPIDATNSVTISVNVTKAGTYSLTVPEINGVLFSKTGTFNTTGVQSVTLDASGTPIADGNHDATVTGGGGSCMFTIRVAPKAGTSAAVYTLTGAPGNCLTPVIRGFYQTGTGLSALNTIELKIDVTTAGDYDLKTDTLNGISFRATGVLPVGAGQIVILKGSGTPVAVQTTTLTPRFHGSACGINIAVTTP